MDVRLDDMALVITGAGRGIGAAIARQAAASGARILLTDRDETALHTVEAELSGADTQTIVADLRAPEAPARIAGRCVDAFGRIDGLVNAAGLTDRASFLDGDLESWARLFDVNARAPFFLMQESIRDMKLRAAAGAIVNIQSINAHCGLPELSIYSATKGALQTLTRNAAQAHLADGIRVNGINLGWVATESERHMQEAVLAHGPGWLDQAAASMPLGRLVQPDEAARLATYLLSPASAPMTGAAIDLEQRVSGAPG